MNTKAQPIEIDGGEFLSELNAAHERGYLEAKAGEQLSVPSAHTTSASPKPRAGEHVPSNTPETDATASSYGDGYQIVPATFARKLQAERDLLREREGEVGKLLKAFCECVETLAFRMEAPNAFTPQFVQLAQSFRAALTKHGR